ncbi:helix-turn-helix transcriptional regulator [Alteribacillus sp. YIM 98480]|uniref:helix-turn-helix domain-containing protein n=1 Tax=Alteribacillus sp. YIM 98480 TaxID=2606599 RepID=UPI00131D2ADD|nr:helix-turn-helix transcriptional regulator [Alteribacillus sp. YIM 98480]
MSRISHGIDYFCTLFKIKKGELAEYLGIKQPQINSWIKGTRDIPQKHLDKLCELFQVPKDKKYLLTRPALSKIDELEIHIILYYFQLNNRNLDERGVKHYKTNIEFAEREIEIQEVINKLESKLSGYTIFPDQFEEKMDKVKRLIENF